MNDEIRITNDDGAFTLAFRFEDDFSFHRRQQRVWRLDAVNLDKGPGRCTDIWLDDESRQLVTARQTEVHCAYEKAHGLIVAAREQVARAVDSGLVTLYWHVGRRIRQDILNEKRAAYSG